MLDGTKNQPLKTRCFDIILIVKSGVYWVLVSDIKLVKINTNCMHTIYFMKNILFYSCVTKVY